MAKPMRGVSEMTRKLQVHAQSMPQRVAAALYQEAQIEATEVRLRTPVWNPNRPVPRGHQPGSLRATIRVLRPVIEGNRIYVQIVAGGGVVDYAIYVHEDLEAFHWTGQAKYLESVIFESKPYIAARVAKRLQLNQLVG